MDSKPRIAIMGAGLAGSLMAIYLARHGFQVAVYERRADMRRERVEAGRSINLGLSARGVLALTEAGVIDQVLARAVRMHGRVVHTPEGSRLFQPYGKNPQEVLYSIERDDLNKTLMQAAGRFPHVTFHFQRRCLMLDKESRRAVVRDETSGQVEEIAADVILGADGAFSTVRQQMQAGERADFHQEYLPWGYKELHLPAGPDGRSQIEHEALHVWPRGQALIVSHPNVDGSHTLTPFIPFEGEESLCSLTTPAAVRQFFQRHFADLLPLMPQLPQQFVDQPTGRLVTIQVAPWYYQDWIGLIGDACHAVYPFYGQGMNAALEDCRILNGVIARHGTSLNWQAIFQTYQAERKRHTDTLAQLSKDNFVELSSRLRSPWFVLRKRADIWLNQLFPHTWLPLYTMVAHTTIPYADAVARAQRQERLLQGGLVGAGMAAILLMRRWNREGTKNAKKNLRALCAFAVSTK